MCIRDRVHGYAGIQPEGEPRRQVPANYGLAQQYDRRTDHLDCFFQDLKIEFCGITFQRRIIGDIDLPGSVFDGFPRRFSNAFADDDGAQILSQFRGQSTAGAQQFRRSRRQLAAGDFKVQTTLNIYSDEFVEFKGKVDAGLGIAMAITREFVVTAEYDGILGIAGTRHINFGIGYFFDPIEIDVGIRYGIWSDHYYLSRMLKIMYIRYF